MEGNFVNFKTYFRDACHPGCQKFYRQNEAISEKFQVGFSILDNRYFWGNIQNSGKAAWIKGLQRFSILDIKKWF